MLALHGLDAYGLEISPIGAQTADSYTRAQMKEPLSYNFGSAEYAKSHPGPGQVEIIEGDFFASNWLSERGIDGFDIVYDYTVSPSLHVHSFPFLFPF